VKGLPEADKDDALLRVLRGDGALLRTELLRRFRGAGEEPAAATTRTVGDLLAAAENRWKGRQREAREREAEQPRRREEAAAVAREHRLGALARDPGAAWTRVEALIAAKRATDYDAAVRVLQELRKLAARDGDSPAFRLRMRQLRERHLRKVSLLERFDRARLG
jgi:hypothetical protein